MLVLLQQRNSAMTFGPDSPRSLLSCSRVGPGTLCSFSLHTRTHTFNSPIPFGRECLTHLINTDRAAEPPKYRSPRLACYGHAAAVQSLRQSAHAVSHRRPSAEENLRGGCIAQGFDLPGETRGKIAHAVNWSWVRLAVVVTCILSASITILASSKPLQTAI